MAGKAGTERWHQRDAGQWQALIVRQAGSGLSVADFCRRESISTASFYRWRRLLGGGLGLLGSGFLLCFLLLRAADAAGYGGGGAGDHGSARHCADKAGSSCS